MILEIGSSVDTAGATHEDLAIILRVHIEEDRSCDHTLAEVFSAFEADFLIDSKESFERAMDQVGIDHSSHSSSDADTIVSAQSSATSLHPIAIDISIDRIVHKVMIDIIVLLSHHIHVTLEHNDGSILISGSGGATHYDIAHSVGLSLNAMVGGKLEEERSDFFFMA